MTQIRKGDAVYVNKVPKSILSNTRLDEDYKCYFGRMCLVQGTLTFRGKRRIVLYNNCSYPISWVTKINIKKTNLVPS